jgi:hypothetical protein
MDIDQDGKAPETIARSKTHKVSVLGLAIRNQGQNSPRLFARDGFFRTSLAAASIKPTQKLNA